MKYMKRGGLIFFVALSSFLALYFFYQISVPNNKLMLRAKSAYTEFDLPHIFFKLKII